MKIFVVGRLSPGAGLAFVCAKYGIEIMGRLPWATEGAASSAKAERVPWGIETTSQGDLMGIAVAASLQSVVDARPEWIVLDIAGDASCLSARTGLADLGFDADKILDARREWAACLDAFKANVSAFGRRDFSLEGEALVTRHHLYPIAGKYVADQRADAGSAEHLALVGKLLDAYRSACTDEAQQPAELIIGEFWKEFLKKWRPNLYEFVQAGNTAALADLLSNFFRNELSYGIHSDHPRAFEEFCQSQTVVQGCREVFNVWKHSVDDPDIGPLDTPRVGNPFGIILGDTLVHANSLMNDFRAQRCLSLIETDERPVVIEVGGGFGGFGHALFARGYRGTYINFDLPETLMVSSYFLSLSHPDAKILVYSQGLGEKLADVVNDYDIILMPHYMIRHMKDLSVDLCLNTISMSEMDYRNISFYLAQFARVSKAYILHENMLDSGEGYKFYPTVVFPDMPGFKLMSSAPSRWPFLSLASQRHFHAEHLFLRRGVPLPGR